MSNYLATVVQLNNLTKHPNADRLQITNIFGNTVIVGLDAKIGDIGLFFPVESQIGLEFANANDLIRRKDENGKSVGGMFDTNRIDILGNEKQYPYEKFKLDNKDNI